MNNDIVTSSLPVPGTPQDSWRCLAGFYMIIPVWGGHVLRGRYIVYVQRGIHVLESKQQGKMLGRDKADNNHGQPLL